MAQAQNVQVNVDESQLSTTYANAFRHQSNNQEVVIDFGLNVATPRQSESDPQQMNLRMDNRLVMNYATTKRLAGMLVQLVQAYEQRNGEIKVDQTG